MPVTICTVIRQTPRMHVRHMNGRVGAKKGSVMCVNGHNKDEVGRRPSGQCAQCARQITARWQANHLGWIREKHRIRQFAQRGLTRAEFEQLLEKQGGMCAICRQPPPLRHGQLRLHVDHHHVTGAFRGLLCQRCNIGIGQFQDSVDLLRAAIVYLEAN